jgi:methionyl-tRNA formyltransferase
MKISILCSDPAHPVMAHLLRWQEAQRAVHDVSIFRRRSELPGGDLLFLISCGEMIGPDVRARYRNTLVIHASDLPRGRGWSPLIWQVLEGAREITVSMIEAVNEVDAGPIWRQERLRLEGHELFDELNRLLFDAELRLMDWAVANVRQGAPAAQRADSPTYYRKRTPADSRLDPDRTIAAQFDLMRVCDPVRYPAYFEWRGHRYAVTLTKIDNTKPAL